MIPIAEIYFLLKISDIIGGGETLLIIVFTGVLGAWLLKKQGASIFQEIQKSATQSQLPSEAIARGFFTFIGGVLLLTPGLITDALGMSLIFPLTQALWKRYFMKQWESGIQNGNIHVVTNRNGFGYRGGFGGAPQSRDTQKRFDPNVIDVDVSSSQTVDKKE